MSAISTDLFLSVLFFFGDVISRRYVPNDALCHVVNQGQANTSDRARNVEQSHRVTVPLYQGAGPPGASCGTLLPLSPGELKSQTGPKIVSMTSLSSLTINLLNSVTDAEYQGSPEDNPLDFLLLCR